MADQANTPNPSARQPRHSPGPWRACKEGACRCGQVWTQTHDHPVAVVTRGAWGDTWPALRTVDISEGMLGAAFKVEAFIERMNYGEVSAETAAANARLIAAAPDLLHALRALHSAFNAKKPLSRKLSDALEAMCRDAIAKAEGKPSPAALEQEGEAT